MRLRRRRAESGQSTVEFALVLPLVLLLVLVLAQLGLVVYAQLAVSHSARELARSLAVDPSADIDSVLEASAIVESTDLETSISFSDATVPGRRIVVVTVSYEVPELPLVFGLVARSYRASATAAMLIEQ